MYSIQHENTKNLIALLENPILSGLKAATSNMFDYYNEYVLNGKQNAYKVDFDFDVFLPSIQENLQRDFVWKQERQISYIESLFRRDFMLMPVMVNLVRNNDGTKTIKVVDGKQRLNAIRAFINGEFCVHGFYFKNLGQGFYSYVSRLVFEVYYDDLSDEQLVALFDKVNFLNEPQDKVRFLKIKDKINGNQM